MRATSAGFSAGVTVRGGAAGAMEGVSKRSKRIWMGGRRPWNLSVTPILP
jgi:hypothetical protein